MVDTTFVPGTTIASAWLNDVNDTVYGLPDSSSALKGAGLVSFVNQMNYAVGTIGWHTRPFISVSDFFTQAEANDWLSGTPVLDYTAALNRATLATTAFTTNENAPKRCVRMPAGNWNVAGPVYVRKGQELRGDGPGAVRILQDPGATTSIFKMGVGLISGVETPDPGGLAPAITNLHIASSSATMPAIDTGLSAGFYLQNLFMTNVGIGLLANGGDGIIDQCIFDQGLVGVSVQGAQNLLFSNCLFYLLNYQVRIDSGSYDIQFDNCHFEYAQYASVLFPDLATNIRDISFSDCQFVLNQQYATFLGFVHVRTGDLEATFSHCKFRNMKGYAVTYGTGIGADLTYSNCVFNGLKTVAAYTQSTTAGGIYTANGNTKVIDCDFLNLNTYGLALNGAFASRVEVRGGSWKTLSTPSWASITNTSGSSSFSAQGMRGDGVVGMINVQGTVPVKLQNNVDWLGANVTGGGRVGVAVPCQYANQWMVTVRANAAPGGSVDYRKTSSFVVQKENGFNAGAARQTLTKNTLLQTPADSAVGVIDIQLDFTAIGGGATIAGNASSGTVFFTVPNTFANIEFSVEPLV